MIEPGLYLTPEIREKMEKAYQEEISLRAFQRETKKYMMMREGINTLAKKKVNRSAFVWDEKKGWVDADWSILPVPRKMDDRGTIAFTKANLYK